MYLSLEEKQDMLRDAQEKLFEVIETLEELFGDDGNAQAYMIDHLKIKASSGHGFLSSDLNLDELYDRLSEQQEDE